MKILIEGTEEEVQRAKDVMNVTCVFNSEFCYDAKGCDECEKVNKLEINYVIKNQERSQQ